MFLSRTLVVALTRSGLAVPGGPLGPAMVVRLGHVMVIEALASGRHDSVAAAIDEVLERVDVDRGALVAFTDQLERQGLLRDTTPEIVPAPPRAAPVIAEPPEARELSVVMTPLVFRPTPEGFELLDHEGCLLLRVDAVELAAISYLREPVARTPAIRLHREEAGPLGLTEPRYDDVVARFARAGLIESYDRDAPEAAPNRDIAGTMMRREIIAVQECVAAIERHMAVHDEAEREREGRTGQQRVRVVPVTYNGPNPPLALGLIVAYAKAVDDGKLEEEYDFVPQWIVDDEKLTKLASRPGVFLFSNYVWSYQRCLAASALIKQISPNSITIHGGPSTPKYEGDLKTFFRANPHVDVCVRGEGEATTAAILQALVGVVGRGDGLPDLSVLDGVEGCAYRVGDRIVRNPDRDRIADLDSIPSPYLTGLFDSYGEVPDLNVGIETNRGCPYGCTFCDWGAATLSRIRKFSLDRVMAELELLAQRRVRGVGPCDANFGIWERDVAIAEKVAEMKAKYGYPRVFGANYAKNTVKHLKKIIGIMVEADILSHGIVSLQSMDADTLDAVERSNIRLDKYEELASEFRRAKLPLFVDLMVGLPGQTPASFRSDLQECIDREVQVRIPITELLANSPMNDPEYRAKFHIETQAPVGDLVSAPLVISTSTFTRQDYDNMRDLRRVFLLCEDFGAFRQIARYVRHETGVKEVDFYERLRLDARSDPERWPHLALLLQTVPDLMAPPISWGLLMGELHEYLVDVLGVPDDSALKTAITVQHALLPSHEREFPMKLELEHDYAAWHDTMLETKDRLANSETEDRADWPEVVPHLRTFGPASFPIDDPGRMASLGLGIILEGHGFGANWEFDSPISRPFFVGQERAKLLLTV
jgi:radical SAM superfamily enzyme YgiQ (UPF0313 family)